MTFTHSSIRLGRQREVKEQQTRHPDERGQRLAVERRERAGNDQRQRRQPGDSPFLRKLP